METRKSTRATANEITQLFMGNPRAGKRALEEILEINPELFAECVPQVFDKQTSLYAKDYFENELLPYMLKEARKKRVPLSYIMFDLDNFHDFNKQNGHVAGDKVLRIISYLLNASFRTKERRIEQLQIEQDNRKEDRRMNNDFDWISYLGRIGGGEEFGVILYDCSEEDAKKAANRFLERVRNCDSNVTVSGGVAEYHKFIGERRLRKRADKALYYSKNTGKNRVTRYSQVPE
mgnify:CR=1 FL=1